MKCHGKHPGTDWRGALGPCPNDGTVLVLVWSWGRGVHETRPCCGDCVKGLPDGGLVLSAEELAVWEVTES